MEEVRLHRSWELKPERLDIILEKKTKFETEKKMIFVAEVHYYFLFHGEFRIKVEELSYIH